MSLPAHPRSKSTPRLNTVQLQPHMADVGLEGIMKSSPKRKRTGSQSEISRNFAPELSQELEKAREFAEINSHFKGERFSPMVFVTPKDEGSKTGDVGAFEEGANSPRSVANRLGEMVIRDKIPVLRFGGEGEKERKKARLEGFEDVSSAVDKSGSRTVDEPSWHNSLSFREKVGQVEVPETPQLALPSGHRGSPPPPISPSASSVSTSPALTDMLPEPPSSPSAADLTWQDSEITGHLALDSDDDGYGVNGIGFRPTAAMAHARSQRRRQQIMEWRNRESREARSRRAEERRRGIKIGRGGATGEKERCVRFAE